MVPIFRYISRYPLNPLRRILNFNILVQLIINKSHQGNVKLSKCPNYFIINVKWKSLIKQIRSYPCDLLSHNFYLIIYTFNAVKTLFEALGYRAVCHPFFIQSLAHYNILAIYFQTLVLWEICKQRY